MRIKVTNTEAIDKALDAAQGKRTAHILYASEIAEAAEKAEKRLDNAGVPKNQRQGITAKFNPHVVPNSYYGNATGTVARLVRRSKDWALVDLYGADVPHRSNGTKGNDLTVTIPTSIDRDALLASMPRSRKIGLA